MDKQESCYCPLCKGVIFKGVKKCQHCGEFFNVPRCPDCQTVLQETEVKDSVSLAGCLGIFLFLCGLFLAFVVNLVGGVLVIIVALLISVFGRGTHTVTRCPCGYSGVGITYDTNSFPAKGAGC
jgi:hypothetical protein